MLKQWTTRKVVEKMAPHADTRCEKMIEKFVKIVLNQEEPWQKGGEAEEETVGSVVIIDPEMSPTAEDVGLEFTKCAGGEPEGEARDTIIEDVRE